MKDRMTLGRTGDVRDLTADIGIDPYATERIFEALDWEQNIAQDEAEERRQKRRVRDAVQMVSRKMGAKYAAVAGAYLRGRKWTDLGIPERTFQHRLKKVKIFFHA